MKILFADLEREWRGGQSQALLTLCGLQAHGHEIELLGAKDSALVRHAKDAGITVHEAACGGLRGWAAIAIGKLMAAGRFALIHANEPHALTAAWMAGVQKDVPLLLSRRIGFPLQKNFISRARYRAVDKFLANSKEVARTLVECGIASQRILIVNEGVEIPAAVTGWQRVQARQRWRIAEKDFLFGCVSVLVPEKGQKHLLDALAIMRASRPQARLILAGDGACRADLESQASRLKLEDAVIFAGFVENVAQVYAALDAFVFPSEFEGLGTALQTAMAMGLPCVSTTRGGLAEVVEHERTALVAEPSGEAFAQAMLRIMDEEILRSRIGEAGKLEVTNRFSADRMVENTIQAYQEVLLARHTRE